MANRFVAEPGVDIRAKYADFKPLSVDEPDASFGAMGDTMKRLAPMYRSYKEAELPDNSSRKWERVVGQWFYRGLSEDDQLIPRDGIDKDAALKHIGSVLRSWEPAHEVKTGICAFLLELWFADYIPAPKEAP